MKQLQQRLVVHALPTVLIGFEAATFQRKLWALLHSVRLEIFTEEGLREWCASLLTVASDYGVERRLADLQNVMAPGVSTWFEDTQAADVLSLVAGPAPMHPRKLMQPQQAPLMMSLKSQARRPQQVYLQGLRVMTTCSLILLSL